MIALKVITITIALTSDLKHSQKENKSICMVSRKYNFRQHTI